jgi:peroxiredoxin Q/BCP
MSFKVFDTVISVWLILFVVWGLPLTHYRSRFRKIVYQTENWVINIKPVFWDEIKALFGNVYPENPEYLKMRNFYRFYLIVYTLLFVVYRFVG